MLPVPIFWLVALLLVAATVAALVWPLLRARARLPVEREDIATTDIYRDQKRQLDAELAAGAITPEQRDTGLDELATRLGAELDTMTAPSVASSSTRSSYVAALVLAAALPVTALMLYAAFGNPGAMRLVAPANERAPMSHDQVVAMVESLATRMKEHPEDPTGWRLLARAYSAMGRYPESVAAFTEAAARGTADASLLADWADALAMRNQSLEGEPSTLVARALALDPNHSKALSLAASAALERKDFDGAIVEWRKLQAQFPTGSDEAKEIGAMIAEADAAKRGAPVAPPASAKAAPSGNASTPPPNAPAPNASAADASAIMGRVSLDPKLRERAAATDTLFIFARAVAGPRMPLAVVRTTADALPHDFRLDDSMAMTPAARLSTAKDVIVEARISKTGSATPSPGDLQGTSAPVRPGTDGVSIVINDVVR